MDKRADYLIQVLEQIGSPLMSSIIATSDNGDAQSDAQTMASLLGKTVELGISMANMADLSSIENDSVRVALTGLASPLIAEMHAKNQHTPSDNDLKRVASALQAVLTFSENFTPDQDNTERLKALSASGSGADAHQITVQYMHAFLPAVNAVAAFPFGQPEQKLIMDVSSRLTAKASAMREALLGDVSDQQREAVDLAILKSLVDVYAKCHEAETKKLSAAGDEGQDSAAALQNVWKSFDIRAAMLEALAASLIPGGSASQSASTESPAPAQETVSPVEAPAEPAPAQPVEESKTEAAATPPSGNPMSMFAKPKTDETPAQSSPAAQDSEPSNTPSEADDDSSGDTGGDSSGGGPMSFFKKSD